MSDDDSKLEDNFSAEEVERLRSILDSDNEAKSKTRARKHFSLRNLPGWLKLLMAVVVVVGLAFGYVKIIEPWIAQMNATAELEKDTNQKPVVAQNTDFIKFKPDAAAAGEIPKGVNPNQLGLGEGTKLTDPASFIFASNSATADSHVVDVYMDFYSQRSRDFITINKSTLENQIETGKIILKIHPVLNSEPFSIYAPEALAEAFGTAPEKAWSFFTDLLKESITLTGNESSEEIVDFIAKNAKENIGREKGDPNRIDAESIVNGTFLTWLYTAADDPKLAVGYTPPVIYIDDKEIDQDTWTINDPEMMVKLFSSLS